MIGLKFPITSLLVLNKNNKFLPIIIQYKIEGVIYEYKRNIGGSKP